MAHLPCRVGFVIVAHVAAAVWPFAALAGDATQKFLAAHCTDCHDGETKKGGLDLTALKFDPGEKNAFAAWVKVFDRIQSGEMPPKSEEPPPKDERDAFLQSLLVPLTAADQALVAKEGRATRRRLNRFEYEATLRDLLGDPHLQVRNFLPEDGEAHLFNKVGDALDVSHVNMARYLSAADYALRQSLQLAERPETKKARYYTRDDPEVRQKMREPGPIFRRLIPMLGLEPQNDVRTANAKAPITSKDPAQRDQEALGVLVSMAAAVRFGAFKAPVSGLYRLRISAYSFWVGSTPENHSQPDPNMLSAGRRQEPVTLYADRKPRSIRKLGSFDATPEQAVHEIQCWLYAGDMIRVDAARFFRGFSGRHFNPLADASGMPGVAFQWMDVEGPLIEQWPPAGQTLLFGALPARAGADSAHPIEFVSSDPMRDAAALLPNFMARAYRRPQAVGEAAPFLALIQKALAGGYGFTDAMLAGYAAVLCSPEFLYLDEKPGRLNDWALATRLSYFLINAAPDAELRTLAAAGTLHEPAVLRAQTERLLNDPRSQRFIDNFMDYWLDLRRILATAPDAALYPDYQEDDLLVESMIDESKLFFAELLKHDLGARHVVASEFAMLNERLAAHYGIPGVAGVALRKVTLPPESVRGGLLTQASVLKVTANGTTTSPVLRGAWIMERILGEKPLPPPPSVPAVEPDTRGATTIREQLDRHRSEAACAACHKKIDPAGFALESFDTMGGWRQRYRVLSGKDIVKGVGKNGVEFQFSHGPAVDASGELPDGRKFSGVRELKKLLLADETQLARNLVRQFVVYATGAAVRFSDRPVVDRILDKSRASGYGVRTLVHEVVQSELFRNK